jgi:hypothetical protein
MAGWEYAMLSRARVGLVLLGLAASPVAVAHGPGVTHTYEGGQPVITVRLVPDEAAIANAKRINALDPAPMHAAPSEDAAGVEPASAAPETLQPAVADEFAVPETPEAANALPSPNDAAGLAAPVSRYPTARPELKPDTETGVGGALDLSPPPDATASQPRPMRLNSVDRPRRVTERAPRAQPTSRPVQPAARKPARPAEPDPLDEALPSRIVEAPVKPMQLPPPKVEERLAGGN